MFNGIIKNTGQLDFIFSKKNNCFIQIRSNLGTGVATADIANAVNASIALVSDVGGVALASLA